MPHLKVSLDAPIMPVKTPDYIRQAALDVGSLQALSHFGGEYKRGPDGKVIGEAFYAPFVRAMKQIGYRGYIGYELCHTLPIVNGKTVGIEYAEANAQMAAEFMRGLITSEIEALSMRTNLAIDDELPEETLRLGGHRTKRNTVNEALQEYIQR